MVSTDLSNMMMERIESKRRRRQQQQQQQQRQQQSKIGDEDNFMIEKLYPKPFR